MKEAIKKQNWCNDANKKYARELDDLYKVGSRVDAWRDFFKSASCGMLKKLSGDIIYFNKFEYFERLICELKCTEGKAIASIEKVTLSEPEINFLRDDIYDSRAWCRLPLSCFALTKGFNERTERDLMQWDVLKYNQMPEVQLGINKAWTVSRGWFKFSHKIKNDERYAEISFNHPQLDKRFKGRRWCADGKFPRSATRQEMEAVLWGKVNTECQKHLVTVEPFGESQQ